LKRAEGLGVRVLVFTVDLPVSGARYRDMRSGFALNLPPLEQAARALDVARRPRWVRDVWLSGRPHHFGNIVSAVPEGQAGNFAAWIHKNFDPTVTFADIAWIRERWTGTIVVKGVLDPEDAVMAADVGVDGIVVSNHGGRQLDGALSSAAALPPIVEAVGARTTVLMDGGVRSGLDVLKALALGAKGVLLGRAWAYALGADGEKGVARMLDRMRSELQTAMALTGCVSVRDAGPELLTRSASLKAQAAL
jgi:L-lactate dehydrogenase (cytochrome)